MERSSAGRIMPPMKQGWHGFTLLELLIVIGIIGVLLGILLPAAEHVRHQAYIDNCASNLRQIGLGISNYGNENRGNYPRTTYLAGAPLTEGTGSNSADSFTGPQPNDLTASIYLLLRTQHLPTVIFICPYDDEITYVSDPADPTTHANFTDWTINLGYSFANPYPDDSIAKAGYALTTHMSSSFAVAADRNPGINPPRSNVTLAAPGAQESIMEQANSINHEQDGQ